MNGPGGGVTPGLDGAVGLLAAGAERPRVLREALAAALRATHATHALLLRSRIGEPVVLAAIGTGCAPLETVTREALAGGPSRRSDPVAGLNAAAVPVWVGSTVVAALGVAGPADVLNPVPLDTAVDVVSLTLRRATGTDAARSVAELFPTLAQVPDADGAVQGLMDAVNALAGLPAFVAVEEEGRLRVARYQGVDRDRLTTLVTAQEFRVLVERWRGGGSDGPTVVPTEHSTEVVGYVPLGVERWHGLVAVVGGRDEVDEVLAPLASAATLAGLGLDRAAAASTVRERAREVDAVIDALPAPTLLVGDDGRLVRANPPAVELLGLAGEFDRGRSIIERLGHPDLERLLAGGEGDVEIEFGTPARHYTVRSRALPGGDRRVIVFTDASAEQEKLRLTDEFVSVMGHELRTPLTVIQGTLQTVRSHGDAMSPGDLDRLTASAARQSTHLGYLIEDLLLMSTEAGRRPTMHSVETDLYTVTSETVQALAEGHPDRSIDVVPVGSDFSLIADPARLGQVVRHLVDNALRHTDGPVSVELSGTGDGVELVVADQGDGIFSGDVERMFEPFVQGDSSSTRRQGGCGIGLYLTRLLVEAMGGRVTCDPRLGQGTRFVVRLPRRPLVRTAAGSGSREVTATRDHASS